MKMTGIENRQHEGNSLSREHCMFRSERLIASWLMPCSATVVQLQRWHPSLCMTSLGSEQPTCIAQGNITFDGLV
jgi:hypothetical protein